MITEHLERAAIEIHFALADLSIRQTTASPRSEEEDKALLAALRFALFELEWIRRRLEDCDAPAAPQDATPRLGAASDDAL